MASLQQSKNISIPSSKIPKQVQQRQAVQPRAFTPSTIRSQPQVIRGPQQQVRFNPQQAIKQHPQTTKARPIQTPQSIVRSQVQPSPYFRSTSKPQQAVRVPQKQQQQPPKSQVVSQKNVPQFSQTAQAGFRPAYAPQPLLLQQPRIVSPSKRVVQQQQPQQQQPQQQKQEKTGSASKHHHTQQQNNKQQQQKQQAQPQPQQQVLRGRASPSPLRPPVLNFAQTLPNFRQAVPTPQAAQAAPKQQQQQQQKQPPVHSQSQFVGVQQQPQIRQTRGPQSRSISSNSSINFYPGNNFAQSVILTPGRSNSIVNSRQLVQQPPLRQSSVQRAPRSLSTQSLGGVPTQSRTLQRAPLQQQPQVAQSRRALNTHILNTEPSQQKKGGDFLGKVQNEFKNFLDSLI